MPGQVPEIDRILRESVSDPVGPEFMAPASRRSAAKIGGIRGQLA
jgi:hypothetical protein